MDPSESFAEYARARAPSLVRFGYVLTGNQHDADDLAQEALIRLGAAWGRVRQKGDPEGYVRTIMVRLHISWWRRRRRERLVGAVPERAYVDGGLADVDSRGGLWQALRGLAPRQRAVLVLRYYEHLSDEQVAAVLGISRGTVRSTAFRALERLRSDLGGTASAARSLLSRRSS